MNAGDILSLLILLIVVGSSLIQSLTKKAPNAGPQKSDRSLSEIKKYLEEMAQGGGAPQKPAGSNPVSLNNPKAKPLYTEPYNAQKKQSPSQKNVASQRGFEQFLDAMPGTAQGRPGMAPKPVFMATPEEGMIAETNSQKRSRVREEQVTDKNLAPEHQAKKKIADHLQTGDIFTQFHIPEHLTNIQKAFVLSEILAPRQKIV